MKHIMYDSAQVVCWFKNVDSDDLLMKMHDSDEEVGQVGDDSRN